MNSHTVYPLKAVILISMAVLSAFLLPVSFASAQAGNVVVNEESGNDYRDGLDRYKKKQYAEALVLFRKSYELDDRNINALFAEGLTLNKMKKDAEAAAVLEKVLEIDPLHEKALKLLPVSYAGAGMDDKALTAYDRGIKSYPESFSFYEAKGGFYMRFKQYDNAASMFILSLEKTPGRMEALEKLAYAYKEAGRMEKAFEVACEILAKDDLHARARVISGDYKRLSGKLEEALTDYKIAAKNIETKAYAEHFIEVINRQIEEQQIEQEYQELLKQKEGG